MNRSRIVGFAGALVAVAAIVTGGVHAKPVTYNLPEETAQFRPGPNLDVAVANCSGCHSVDYMHTQPRGLKFTKDFWTAEVNKMIKVYGAPIEEADVGKIVEYLTATH